MSNLNKVIQKLSPQEKAEYDKLSQIFNDNNLNEVSLDKGIKYLSKNWKNYSKAMLMALLLNPNISSALNDYSPQTVDAIKTELNVGNKDKVVSKQSEKSIDFSQNFESGKSNITDKDALKAKLGEIQNFLKGKDAKKFLIKIIASESQVTNPHGYGKGELAQERAQNLESILSKMGFSNIEKDTKIGSTSYTKGKDNPSDQKFTDEQFVRVEIYLNTETICNLNDEVSGGKGDAANNYITYNEDVEGEGTINFSTGTIPDRLVISDDKGNIVQDLGYVTTKVSTYKEWKYVPTYVAQLTKLNKENNIAVSGAKIKKIKASSMEELVKQLLNGNFDYTKDTRQEVASGLKELQSMIDSGVTEFVIYDNSPSTIKVNFNGSNIKVYSPLGSTGFSLVGQCK